MKNVIAFMCALFLLLCAHALAEIDPQVLGTWEEYAIVWNDVVTTRADIDKPNGFVFQEDDTVLFTENTEVYAQGSWTWEDENQALRITDDKGTKAAFIFMDNMLFSIAYFENAEMFTIYYKPEILTPSPEEFFNCAWEMEYLYDGDTKHSAWAVGNSYSFTLNEDGTVSVLSAYSPQNGTWHLEGFNLVIETDWGASLVLEPQFDDTLYGVYSRGDTAFPVILKPTVPFFFYPDPVPISDLQGVWQMTGLRNEMLFYYPREELTFDFTLTVSGSQAELTFDGETDDFTTPYSASTTGGPLLDENDTGTILLLTDSNGLEYPAWLLADGSLYLRNPGSSSYYFARQ